MFRLKAFNVNIVGIKRSDHLSVKDELGLGWVGTSGQMKELLNMSDYVVLCLPLTSEGNFVSP